MSTAKPQVLLVGQYSVGKTSFIRYLLGRDFPGQRIGPEPTTDRFTGECHVIFLSSLRFSFLGGVLHEKEKGLQTKSLGCMPQTKSFAQKCIPFYLVL